VTDKEIIYLAFHSIRQMAEVIIFVVIFSHVWTRKGYEGHDGVLDLKEVDKFITHIISAVSLITLDTMQVWEPVINHPVSWEWKIVFAGGFLGSGIYILFGPRLKAKLEEKKPTEQNA
jgi:hypothetical protein